MENINLFDVVVVAFVVILGLKGLMRGFIKELFALVGIIGGVFIASRLAKDAGEIVNGFFAIDNESTVLLVGFIAALIVFWIVAYILGAIIEKVFELSGLGVIDRTLGFLFGAGKIFLLFAMIAYATTKVKFVHDMIAPKLQASTVFPILVGTGAYIIKLDTGSFSDTVQKKFNSAVDSTKKTIDDISTQELQKQLQETTNTK